MTVLHATEPATVYLSCWARVAALEVADVDRALYDDRSLVKQLAMRRTLFVFPRDLLPAVWPSASARVAGSERARMSKDAVKAGLAADGDDWLDRARAAVLAVLAEAPDGRSALWCRASGAGTAYIDPGSPWQNPYVESFNARLRDELLAVEQFDTILEAKVLVDDWRIDYNLNRPHSSLGYLTPAYAATQTQPPLS